ARAGRKLLRRGHLPQPLGLREDRATCFSSHSPLYTIATVTETFPWIQREHVRFRDCDAMGHVNNAVYSTYLEQARIGILGDLEPFILARVEIDFRAELRADEQIEVRSRCSKIGIKSFELEHQIWTGDRLVADAKSVLVGYDYTVGASVPLTENQRRRLAA
ncbi:MAG: acyl-CoA thioester hydrolase, partial [Gaiellaceae bacterium]|nr:acyl-CoA thioester hydrolase [Gaiellaceae bacterium]